MMKAMRRAKGNDVALAGLIAVLLLMAGCLVVDGNNGNGDDESGPSEQSGGECNTHCYQYEGCETYIDTSGSFEEDCTFRETCEIVCDANASHPDASDTFGEPEVCYSDHECQQGRVCTNGQCTSADSDERGNAGLCQTCESRQDCAEPGALCLGLNYEDSDGPTETICGRACESDQECPGGFTCFEVSGDGGDLSQCVPETGSDNQRSCAAGGELECVSASDCALGESCIANSCQPPSQAECTQDSQCDADQICELFECVEPTCVAGSDCGGDELCIDGECCAEGECGSEPQSCVFNAECPSDERCVDGTCTATCSDDEQCGNSERCRQGICEYIECTFTSDCSSAQICVEASCEQACDSDANCADGFLCSGFGFCTPDPDVECRSSAECATDELCTDQGVCETPCDCNQQCADGDVCDENIGLCETPDSGADEVQCDDDCDCPSGATCDDGQCL